ncbi:MAG: hypothetical protein ABI969_01115 [bacterium]
MNRRRGFALMAAMWLVVLLGVCAWQLSLSSRARRLAAANALELIAARAAADAGLETGRAVLTDTLFDGRIADTLVMESERATVSYYDPASRLHLNRASVEDLRRFLAALPMDADGADRLAQRIADWRDADDQARPRGAERADYVRTGARRLPSNTAFGTLDELLSVDGMSPTLLARIAPFVTLVGVGQVNVNVAPPEVLRALPAFGDEAIGAVMRLRQQHRAIHSINELTNQLSRSAADAIALATTELDQRLTFETREYLVESTGWVDGSPVRARGELLLARSGESALVQSRRSRVE